MLVESIKGINLQQIDDIYIVCLKEHINSFGVNIDIIKKQFKIDKNILFIQLENSESHIDTVRQVLETVDNEIEFIVKDCDNYFIINDIPECDVAIATYSLNECDLINPSNKDYILENNNNIANVSNKKVVSHEFSCGLYYFKSSSKFMEMSKNIDKFNNIVNKYISYEYIVQKITTKNYIDWGTIEDWKRFKENYITIFCDFDGVLVYSSSEYMKPSWGETDGIVENIKVVNDMYESGQAEIIITTSRKKEYNDITLKQIERIGLKYHSLINLNLGSKRIVINDFSKTNRYPTCEAINIYRDLGILNNMI